MMDVPITEQSNALSKDIDTASPIGIVQILEACDYEIFNGWSGSGGIHNELIINKVTSISKKIKEVLDDPVNGKVIISGCGTSGRIAFLTTRTFNNFLKTLNKAPCFQYIIAGGDKALFTSQELPEDDPIIGAELLKKASEGKSKVVFIGVTCGLSAPFVAGQIDHCLSHLDTLTPVLLGFNPCHLARNLNIQELNKTFLDVVKDLQFAEESGKGFILNPIVGPETITGSSRMKSGSTTRIMLETLALSASEDYTKETVSQVFNMYENICISVYKETASMASVIQMAGDSLASEGHIYYLGSGGFGLMAMIDASECPPTYGASLNDIRGFVFGGYKTMENDTGDMSSEGSYYRISFDDFKTDILPNIACNDLIILIGEEVLDQMDRKTLVSSCGKLVYIRYDSKQSSIADSIFASVISLDIDLTLPSSLTLKRTTSTLKLFLQEIAIKLVLNAISTGAHILKGKVLNNYMIDVKVSNNKLFHRAIGIVKTYSGATNEECILSLLKSIYDTDNPSDKQKKADIVEHIKVASSADRVVPKAILMAALRCTVQEVKALVSKQPIIRKLLKENC